MIDIIPIKKGEDIIKYSEDTITFLFNLLLELRDDGSSAISHVKKVAKNADRILKEHYLKRSALAAAWLHDGPEDLEEKIGLRVYDPFNKPSKMHKPNLNNLLKKAGKEGKYTNAIVYPLTFTSGRYFENMWKLGIFNSMIRGLGIKPKKRLKELDSLKIALKTCDRDPNCNPNEKYYINPDILEKYRETKDYTPEKIMNFLKEEKVIDPFVQKGDISYDEELFIKSKELNFIDKQISNASDNLVIYLTLAEEALLIEPGMDGDIFSIDKAEDNPLFNYKELRSMLKTLYLNSFTILDTHCPIIERKKHSQQPSYLFAVRRGGTQRGDEGPPGYTLIRQEIRAETSLKNLPDLIANNLSPKTL